MFQLPADLAMHLDTFNYGKAESILDDLLTSDLENKTLLFWRSVSAMGQYTFGSTRIKEGIGYLNRAGDYDIEAEHVGAHVLFIADLAQEQLRSFVTNTGQEASKSSVGTITDPAWKMVTDSAITKMRLDGQKGHVVEVFDYLLTLNKSIRNPELRVKIDSYSQYAIQNGSDISKVINEKRRQHGLESQDSGFCFVATLVYGSYEHPSVYVLRSFRDDTLSASMAGRVFVKVYYRYGKALANFVEKSSLLLSAMRGILDGIVQYLRSNRNGPERSPS